MAKMLNFIIHPFYHHIKIILPKAMLAFYIAVIVGVDQHSIGRNLMQTENKKKNPVIWRRFKMQVILSASTHLSHPYGLLQSI